jgi:hypothetical protein
VTADQERFTWALAAHLRDTAGPATTHADRHLTAQAFRAGWEAARTPQRPAVGAHRLEENHR